MKNILKKDKRMQGQLKALECVDMSDDETCVIGSSCRSGEKWPWDFVDRIGRVVRIREG